MISQVVYTIILLGSGIILMWLAYLGWQHGGGRIGRTYAVLMAATAWWTIFEMLEVAAGSQSGLWRLAKQIGIAAVPLAWLAFTLAYTGHGKLRTIPGGLLLYAAAGTLLTLTWLDQLPTTTGWIQAVPPLHAGLHIAQVLYPYALLLAGFGLLVFVSTRSLRVYWQRTRFLLLAGTLVALGAFVDLSGPTMLAGWDISLLLLSPAGMLAGHAVLHRSQERTIPVSHESVIDHLPDAILVIDSEHRILSANPAARSLLFDDQPLVPGQILGRLLPESAPLLAELDENTPVQAEIRYRDRYLDMMISPLQTVGEVLPGYVVSLRDVTIRKEAELALSAVELRYRALFENNHDAVYLFDLDTNIILANQRGADLLDVTMEELLTHKASRFIEPDQLDDARQRMERLLNGETIPPYERVFISAAGRRIPAEVSLTLVRDANNQPLHLQTIVRDITERKQAAARLAEERNLLRTLVDTIPDQVFILNEQGRYTLTNPAHMRYLGVEKPEDVLGKTVFDFLNPEQAREIREDDLHVMRFGRTTRYETSEARPNGETRWALVTKIPLQGEETRMVGIVQDVTARKQFEAEQKQLLEQLALLRLIEQELTRSLDIRRVTAAALKIALNHSAAGAGFIALAAEDGRLTISDAVGTADRPGQQPGTILTPDTAPHVTDRVMAGRSPELFTPQTGETARGQMAFPLMSQDRLIGLLYLEAGGEDPFTPEMFDFMKLVAGRMAVAIDNARLYDTVRQKLEEVRQLEQLKSDMIRMASHDLKTPAAVVAGYTELLLMDEDQFSEEHLGFMNMIRQSSARMDQILEDILSLERIQQRADSGNHEALNLVTLLRGAIGEYRPRADEKDQHLVVQYPPHAIQVRGDRAQLYEAVINLISNAVKYTPAAGRIEVDLHAEKGCAYFSVTDTGFGIPHEQQDRLFEPFYRARVTGTETIDGTGLGLHIVKNIVERHGGTLFYKSTYQQGSTFGFTLPIAST